MRECGVMSESMNDYHVLSFNRRVKRHHFVNL
jgi:hypothetical protein